MDGSEAARSSFGIGRSACLHTTTKCGGRSAVSRAVRQWSAQQARMRAADPLGLAVSPTIPESGLAASRAIPESVRPSVPEILEGIVRARPGDNRLTDKDRRFETTTKTRPRRQSSSNSQRKNSKSTS